MISGVVNANREATIRLVAIGPNGQQQEIDAIIDTGFTGFLTLPPALVTTLGLSWLCRQPGILADGSVDFFDVYVARVIWDGQLRTVEVEAADTEPLVGMSLLDQHALRIKRAALFIRMNDLVIEDVVVIPLSSQPWVSAVSHSLRGLEVGPWDVGVWNLAYWYREI